MQYNQTIVQFFPDKHQYFDNFGREYISVTQLLKSVFPFDRDAIISLITKNPKSKYYKRDKEEIIKEWETISIYGNLVHKTIENFITLNEEPTHDSITRGCFKQYADLGFKRVQSEKLLFNVPLLIAGTCDLIVEYDDRYEIWDIKTNSKLDSKKMLQYSMQLNLYMRFAKSILDKPVKVGGILWFDNFFKNQMDTKMSIIKPVNCTTEIKSLLQSRLDYLKANKVVV